MSLGNAWTGLTVRWVRRRPAVFSTMLAALVWFGQPLSGAVATVDAGDLAKTAPAAASGAAPKPAEDDAKTIERAEFTLKYPLGWTEDTQAKDYDPNGNFMLFSPKNSSVQIIIMNKADDPKKVVDNAIKKIDNVQITTLSRSNLTMWGTHRGVGQYLKGKIVDSFPGGIKVFCFSSARHNVLIIETSFSDDLKDVQQDLQYISDHFTMAK
ncbi:MAG TPA: hypothetical protein VHC95_10735 [Opitutales bacterium]|nr:hypothetical protein [Opitutales bacterium]